MATKRLAMLRRTDPYRSQSFSRETYMNENVPRPPPQKCAGCRKIIRRGDARCVLHQKIDEASCFTSASPFQLPQSRIDRD